MLQGNPTGHSSQEQSPQASRRPLIPLPPSVIQNAVDMSPVSGPAWQCYVSPSIRHAHQNQPSKTPIRTIPLITNHKVPKLGNVTASCAIRLIRWPTLLYSTLISTLKLSEEQKVVPDDRGCYSRGVYWYRVTIRWANTETQICLHVLCIRPPPCCMLRTLDIGQKIDLAARSYFKLSVNYFKKCTY